MLLTLLATERRLNVMDDVRDTRDAAEAVAPCGPRPTASRERVAARRANHVRGYEFERRCFLHSRSECCSLATIATIMTSNSNDTQPTVRSE